MTIMATDIFFSNENFVKYSLAAVPAVADRFLKPKLKKCFSDKKDEKTLNGRKYPQRHFLPVGNQMMGSKPVLTRMGCRRRPRADVVMTLQLHARSFREEQSRLRWGRLNGPRHRECL